MTDLVPGGIFLKEKSILVFGNSKVGKNGPWVAKLVKLHVWSLGFESWQKRSSDVKTWKITIQGP